MANRRCVLGTALRTGWYVAPAPPPLQTVTRNVGFPSLPEPSRPTSSTTLCAPPFPRHETGTATMGVEGVLPPSQAPARANCDARSGITAAHTWLNTGSCGNPSHHKAVMSTRQPCERSRKRSSSTSTSHRVPTHWHDIVIHGVASQTVVKPCCCAEYTTNLLVGTCQAVI